MTYKKTFIPTSTDKKRDTNYNSIYSILSSGVDSLYLTGSFQFKETKYKDLIHELNDRSHRAKSLHEAQEVQLVCKEYPDPLSFQLQPHGRKNYQYVLVNLSYTICISSNPNSDYNVFLELRAETLWTLGTREAVSRILNYLKPYIKPSFKIHINRVDPCIDMVMPEDEWSLDLKSKLACWSSEVTFREKNGILESITIGLGNIICRLYDKEREVKKHPQKRWIYSIWKIKKAPPGTKIIRIEFQIRRPALKTVLINDLDDLYEGIATLWNYLTKDWLKFLEKPQRNKDRQKVIPWWRAVQNAFGENINPLPRVRHTAIRMEQEQQAKMAMAYITNLCASIAADERMPRNREYTLDDCIKAFKDQVAQLGITDQEISDNVKKKIVNYQRPFPAEVINEIQRAPPL